MSSRDVRNMERNNTKITNGRKSAESILKFLDTFYAHDSAEPQMLIINSSLNSFDLVVSSLTIREANEMVKDENFTKMNKESFDNFMRTKNEHQSKNNIER